MEQLRKHQAELAKHQAMSNVHLRQQLERRKLSFRGTRTALIDRLRGSLEAELQRERSSRVD